MLVMIALIASISSMYKYKNVQQQKAAMLRETLHWHKESLQYLETIDQILSRSLLVILSLLLTQQSYSKLK